MNQPSGPLTPLMKQYWQVKNDHQDKIMLFRMGDFFEIFYNDAVTAAPIINIALTSRNKKGKGEEVPMCGFPHFSVSGPISKLLAAGHKVAICDQVEDPKDAVGIVKREVTKVITPGMVYDPETLDELSANFVCAMDEKNICFLDVSTGEAFYYEVSTKEQVKNLVFMLSPAEIILSNAQRTSEFVQKELSFFHLTTFDETNDLESKWSSSPAAIKRLLSYVTKMQGQVAISFVDSFNLRKIAHNLEISASTIRQLELFKNYNNEDEGTLFKAINKTKSSGGARLLKSWMNFPSVNLAEINTRHDEVEYWHKAPHELKTVRTHLSQVGDIYRRINKISGSNCQPRDVVSLKDSLLSALNTDQWNHYSSIDLELTNQINKVIEQIDNTLVDEPPAQIKMSGSIKKGFSSDLDEYMELADNGAGLILELEQREKLSTKIPSLKVRYNRVFGYYIEVTHLHIGKVPVHYIRKQTLTNAERYITDELRGLEEKFLSAKTKRIDLEVEVFDLLKKSILASSVEILKFANQISRLDVLTSFAWLSLEGTYCRPVFDLESENLQLLGSRHPVIESQDKGSFVPNDILIEKSSCMLITGPNMAGKSTVMRQVAISALMAQIGCFVAAKKAKLPLYEKLYTRIGANDFLSDGLSTFMVEMTEAAEILKNANSKTLVILDEIGRGTSTYDGLSLAQGILEYLVNKSKAMIMFATHYHELSELEKSNKNIRNAHMKIAEGKNGLRFLYTIAAGCANKSYGIHVAELAGIPKEVTMSAQKILNNLEKKSFDSNVEQLSLLSFNKAERVNADLEEVVVNENSGLIDEIKEMNISLLTPLEALNKLAKFKENLN